MPKKVEVRFTEGVDPQDPVQAKRVEQFLQTVQGEDFQALTRTIAEAACLSALKVAREKYASLEPEVAVTLSYEFVNTVTIRMAAALMATQARASADPCSALVQRMEAYSANLGSMATAMLRDDAEPN